RPPGRLVNVTNPSSISTPSSPNETKKSARAYGSTTAWNDASDSCICSAGSGLMVLRPTAPRKSPMTAISGLKTFEPAAAPPYTGSAPVGPPAPSAPGGTGAVGCCAPGGTGAVAGCGAPGGEGATGTAPGVGAAGVGAAGAAASAAASFASSAAS